MFTKLSLTAIVSLAVGAGGTCATVRVSAMCGTAPASALQDGHFFAAPMLPLNRPTPGY
jgi:hypothetical protein